MKYLKGKNALITGGSRGLGPVVANFLAREGVNIALTARTEESLNRVAENLSANNIKTGVYAGDISNDDFKKQLLKKVRKDFGCIDILINNAGIEWVCAYTDLSNEEISQMLTTNLAAPMLLTRMALPAMIEQKSGHIVNMSSLGGKKGSPFSATYAATKAGLIQWTSGIRAELRGTGVSASVICPGFVSEAGMFAEYNKKAPKIVGETTPEKVAKAVVKAIKKDISEIVVNSGPVWPMLLLEAIHPQLVDWVLRNTGVHEFYRKQAMDNQKGDS